MENSLPRGANLAVRFGSELVAFGMLGYTGYQLGGGLAARIIFAVALPLAAIAAWGLVIAPRARWRASDPARLAVEVAVFASAVVGVAVTGSLPLAVALAVVVAVNIALLFAWGQRGTA